MACCLQDVSRPNEVAACAINSSAPMSQHLCTHHSEAMRFLHDQQPAHVWSSSIRFFSSSCLASLVLIWSELISGQCSGNWSCTGHTSASVIFLPMQG